MATPELMDSDRLQITYYCQWGDQLGLNVRHYEYEGGGVVNERILDAANSLFDDIAPLYTAYLPDTARFLGVSIKRLEPNPTTLYYSTKTPVVGDLVDDDVLPRQVCGIVTLQTGVPGPGGRGRAYLPFPAVTWDAQPYDGPTDAFITAVAPLAAAFQLIAVTGVAGNFTLEGLVKWDNAGTPAYRLITSTITRRKWATQRRRGSYGSTNASPF